MKLDYKMLLNTAIGVAVGMVAYHFIQKAMNANDETVGSIGESLTDIQIKCDKIHRKLAQGIELTVWEKEYFVKYCLNMPRPRKKYRYL